MKQRSIYLGLLLLCMACKPDLEEPYIPRTVSGFSSRLMPHGNSSSPLTATIITTGAEAHFVELRVKGKRDNDLVYRDERLQKSHSVPLIGLYPGFENTVFVRILDAEGKLLDSFEHLVPTDSLDVRIPEISILHPGIIPAERKLIFIEFRTGIASVPFIFDEYGEVRWYLKFPDYSLVRPIMAENRMDFYCGDYGKKCMYWFDWLGNGDTIDLPDGFNQVHHHISRHGEHLFFPVDDDFVMEIDANRNLVKAWNLAEIVKRYLPAEQDMVVEGEDWLHVNSVEYKEEDDALIISARQQLGVFKLDYTSGDIMWILNDTSSRWFSYPALKKLALIPEEGCELPLGQHTPVFIGEDEMLLMDNGYDGYGQSGDSGGLTDGGKGYSRLVIYKINEEEGRVTQEFQYGKERGRELYSKFAGNAGHLPSRDILFALFGNMVSEDGEHNTARYIEFDGNGSIIFEAMLESENASRFFFRASKIDMQMLINNYYL